MSTYVLETSALLAYIEDEPGTTEIDRILRETLNQQHTLYISVISGIDLMIVALQGWQKANPPSSFTKILNSSSLRAILSR